MLAFGICVWYLGNSAQFRMDIRTREYCHVYTILLVHMNSLAFKTLIVYEIVSLYEIVNSHYIKSWDSTARSREDETRNGHRNAKRNPRWSSQVTFQMAHLKRDLNFDHRRIRFAFRQAFRVSSSQERAIYENVRHY